MPANSKNITNKRSQDPRASTKLCSEDRNVKPTPKTLSKHAVTLQTQKDNLIDNFAKYISKEINTNQFVANMNTIEEAIMQECAKIAVTPGCC